MWLANAHAYPLAYHTAGRTLHLQTQGMPYMHAAVDPKSWDTNVQFAALKKNWKDQGRWHDTFGDRASELVFIGVNLNKPAMEAKLREALLTEEESKELGGVDGWRGLPDPFFDGKCAEQFFEFNQAQQQHWTCPGFHAFLQ